MHACACVCMVENDQKHRKMMKKHLFIHAHERLIFSLFFSCVSLVRKMKKVLFNNFLMFFILFDHANACACWLKYTTLNIWQNFPSKNSSGSGRGGTKGRNENKWGIPHTENLFRAYKFLTFSIEFANFYRFCTRGEGGMKSHSLPSSFCVAACKKYNNCKRQWNFALMR